MENTHQTKSLKCKIYYKLVKETRNKPILYDLNNGPNFYSKWTNANIYVGIQFSIMYKEKISNLIIQNSRERVHKMVIRE